MKFGDDLGDIAALPDFVLQPNICEGWQQWPGNVSQTIVSDQYKY